MISHFVYMIGIVNNNKNQLQFQNIQNTPLSILTYRKNLKPKQTLPLIPISPFHPQMNRMSLLGGPMPSNTKQNLKQAAYLQYLKSFAQTGLQTLEKLQTQFNKHNARHRGSEDFVAFQKIRTLISSYEVFILEMNDSCEFIEVPEFGTCLLKVFIQLIGVVKWSLQHLQAQKKTQLLTVQAVQHTLPPSSFNQSLMGSTLFSLTPPSHRRESSLMRNTFNGNLQTFLSKQVKQTRCSQCLNKLPASSPNDIYKMKEQTTMQLKDINEEIVRISNQYTEEEKKLRRQEQERDKLQKFIERREEEGKSYVNIGLGELSRNEEILTEIVYTLNRKGEAIRKFADLRMNSLGEINRIQSATEEEYETLKQEVSTDMEEKVLSAKHRLASLFKEKFAQYERQKRQNMVDTAIQIEETESMKLYKLFHEKLIKKLKGEIRNLQKELQYEKDLNEGMKKLLQQKSMHFQGQVIKYRNQLINLQLKTKKDLKSTRKLHKPFPTLDADHDNNNSSLVSIGMIESCQQSNVKFIQYDDQNLCSQSQDNNDNDNGLERDSVMETKSVLTKSFLKTGKRLNRSKQGIKFKCIKKKGEEFQIVGKVWAVVVEPKVKSMLRLVEETKKVVGEKDTGRTMVNFHVQTGKDLLQQYIFTKYPQRCLPKPPPIPRPLLLHQSATKSAKCSPTSKTRAHVISYTKKRSSHMGDLSNYFEIQTSSNQKKDETSSLLCNKLFTKSSKLLQRGVKMSTCQEHKQMKSDFTPIMELNDGEEVVSHDGRRRNEGYRRFYVEQGQNNSPTAGRNVSFLEQPQPQSHTKPANPLPFPTNKKPDITTFLHPQNFITIDQQHPKRPSKTSRKKVIMSNLCQKQEDVRPEWEGTWQAVDGNEESRGEGKVQGEVCWG